MFPSPQVLECESVSHLTATSTLCFTSGKHCWQFVVAVPCDLVWLGLSDGSLSPDVWGGKQPGGWFYGSNDVSGTSCRLVKGMWCVVSSPPMLTCADWPTLCARSDVRPVFLICCICLLLVAVTYMSTDLLPVCAALSALLQALCHNKQSDRHAYTKHCGNGKWGDGAVVDVCLDMDAREVWFGVDGAEPKLGFSGLPDRVYPAVSLRAPAQLLVRFRAASWIMSEAQHA